MVLPAEPVDVTKFTLIVAADALMLVAVNLSIMAVTPVAVYCVTWVASANLAGTRTLTVTVMVYSKRRMLFGMYCVINQFVPSDTSVAESPVLAKRIDVAAAPPANGTTLLAADTKVCAW